MLKTVKVKYSVVFRAVIPVIIFIVLLSVPFVYAEMSDETAEDTSSAMIIDDFYEANGWIANYNVAGIEMIDQQYGIDTRSCLEVRVGQMTDYSSVIRMYGADPLNLYGYSKISYKVYIASSDAALETGEEYTVVLTLHSGTHTSEYKSKIPTGMWYTITADISDWFRLSFVDAIEIAVYSESVSELSLPHGEYFLIDTITAFGTSDKTISKMFLSNNFKASGCGISYSADKKAMTVTRSGLANQPAYIEGNIDIPSRSSLGEYNAVRIVLENSSQCESMKLEYVSEGELKFSETKSVSSSINKNSGETSYLFFITSDTNLDLIKLTFLGSWEGDITIKAISLVKIDDKFSVPESAQIGNVTKCELSAAGKYISVKGIIPSEMAVKYIDCRLNLYEIPSYSDVSVIDLETPPVMTLDMSTKFEFKLPAEADNRDITRTTYKYVVALVYRDEIIFIDNPKYVTHPQVSIPAVQRSTQKSIKGFHDSGITGIFESGCSYIVIDISCESLLIPRNEVTGAGKLHVRDGYYYYFNSSYINYLDERIKTYSMSGSDVILRLVSTSKREIDSLAYPDADDAVYYAFNTNSASSINQLCAIVDYLSIRYNGSGEGKISGFIVGEKADMFSVYNNAGSLSNDINDYIKNYADSLRIVYSVAYENIPGIKVYASTGGYVYMDDRNFIDEEQKRYDILTGVSNVGIDPSLLIELLCRRISEEGAFPWYLMNEGAGEGYSCGEIFSYGITMRRLVTRMSKKYSGAPVSLSIFWQPESGYEPDRLSADYMELFRLVSDEKCADAVILSIARQDGGIFSEILPMLKSVDSGLEGKSITAQTELIERKAAILYQEDEYSFEYTGRYDFWDFAQAYDSQGWFAGQGSLSVSTEKNSIFGHRILNAEMDGAGTDSCCVMMWAVNGQVRNLSYTPIMEAEIMISSKTSDRESFEVVLVFGTAGGRAEYSAEIAVGIPVKIMIDISEFSSADRVRYAAVMVRGEDSAAVNISRISGYSQGLGNDELKNLIENFAAEEESNENFNVMAVLGIITTVIFTITSILLLSRKKED